MRVRTAGMIVVGMIALCAPITSSASADGPVGTDPAANFTIGSLPPACWSDPAGAQCIEASVGYLDQARASLGQPAYELPGDFASLTAAQQAFVLTNLDRIQYGLPAIPGLAQALDDDAANGVLADNDPQPSDSTWLAYTSNWAGGYQNIVLAYAGWMYDDGPGSGNLDCTATEPTGCWGHRHDILWQFDGPGRLAMGAAAGADSSGTPGDAMLLEQQRPGVHPAYTYTWAEAVADGAGGAAAQQTPSAASPAGAPSASSPRTAGAGAPPTVAAHAAADRLRIERVRVRDHVVTITIVASRSTPMRCSLMGHSRDGRRVRRAKRCGRAVTFSRLAAGTYWFRLRSTLGTVARRVKVP